MTTRPNRATSQTDRTVMLETAPLDELLGVLLRQYRRPLTTKGVEMTETDAVNLMKALIADTMDDAQRKLADTIRAALIDLIAESIGVLAGWKLTFAESLDTEMDAIPGWESTGEFLALAEAKSNAELRISLGSILLYALGDDRHADIVHVLAERSKTPHGVDIDTVLARRLLERT